MNDDTLRTVAEAVAAQTPDVALPAIRFWAVLFVLVMGRVAAFLSTFPIFGHSPTPKLVRVGICLAITLAWLPDVQPNYAAQTPPDHWLAYTFIIGREVMIGGLLGIAFGLLLLPMKIAGGYLSQEMGFSFSGLTDPTSQSSSSTFGTLFDTLGVLLFFSFNVHHLVFFALHESFSFVPLGQGSSLAAASFYATGFSNAHQVGLLIIAPVGICLFTTLVVLMMLMKASPQLNLFSIGFSVRIGVGFVALLCLLPTILTAASLFFLNAADSVPWQYLGMDW